MTTPEYGEPFDVEGIVADIRGETRTSPPASAHPRLTDASDPALPADFDVAAVVAAIRARG